MKKPERIIDVGCALIRDGKQLLITQRLPGTHLGGFWEFPGGKRRAGESLEDCLIREVSEELRVRIEPRERLCGKTHTYPDRTLNLHFYWCDYAGGVPVRQECLDYRWVFPEDLHDYLFPPADRDIIRDIISKKRYYFRRGYFY